MNNIRFNELLTRQFILDENIKKTKGIKETSIQDKVVALEVELSEFANELRFFKYWSYKKPDRAKALTEYVDSLHFFLSLANDLNIDFNKGYDIDIRNYRFDALYIDCKSVVLDIYTSWEMEETWQIAFSHFLAMGENAGFTEDEIYNEYINKNEVNHVRQAEGY